MRLTWVQPEDLLSHQLVQSRSEGVDVADVEARWVEAGGTTQPSASGASDEPASPELRALAQELLAELDSRAGEWHVPTIPDLPVLEQAYERRVLNAWLGRAAGNLLGKPVEKIPREGVREILETSGQWPLTQYITAVGVPDDVQRRWTWNRRSKATSLREVINGMPEDDDLNFAILALQLLERHGDALTTEDVAQAWLNDLPAGRVFTAERVAYRNLLDGVEPARAALVANPFREWIGAQIRTDAYGWAHPGDRTAAAKLALVDARLSHTGAGVTRRAVRAGACGPRAGRRTRRFTCGVRRPALGSCGEQHRVGGVRVDRSGFHHRDRPRGDGWVGHRLGRRYGRCRVWRGARGSGRVVRASGQPGGHEPAGDEPDRDRRTGSEDCGGGTGWSLMLSSWVAPT